MIKLKVQTILIGRKKKETFSSTKLVRITMNSMNNHIKKWILKALIILNHLDKELRETKTSSIKAKDVS